MTTTHTNQKFTSVGSRPVRHDGFDKVTGKALYGADIDLPGLIHGKMIYYWDNGQMRLIGQYENMRRTGTWKTYNPDGELILEENYNSPDQKETKKLHLFPI